MPFIFLLIFLSLAFTGCAPGAKPVVSSRSMSDQSTVAYRCTGTEPFWSVEISPKGIVFQTPEVGPVTYPYFPPVRGSGRMEFNSSVNTATGKSTLRITLVPGDCSDGMSETTYAFSAEVEKDGLQLKGCANEQR